LTIIVLFGPPGVGKGTQGVKLAGEMRIAQFAMGDILREAAARGTPLGIRAKQFMDAGQLVPDEVVIGLIEERIAGDEAANGFILDGFPRNVAQAEALAKMLERHGMAIDRAVFLDAPEEALLERLTGRLLCRSCGFGFHRHYSPPVEEGHCDKCGGELYQRDDDREEVIVQRLEVYRQQTAPLLEYYRGSQAFRHVDAGGEMQSVYAELKKAVAE
jgi:adenylate kinase